VEIQPVAAGCVRALQELTVVGAGAEDGDAHHDTSSAAAPPARANTRCWVTRRGAMSIWAMHSKILLWSGKKHQT